jgi:hypothetical protein
MFTDCYRKERCTAAPRPLSADAGEFRLLSSDLISTPSRPPMSAEQLLIDAPGLNVKAENAAVVGDLISSQLIRLTQTTRVILIYVLPLL